MKKLTVYIILTMFIVACEQPANECDCDDSLGRSLLDAEAMNDIAVSLGSAMSNKNGDAILELLSDDVVWNFPNKQTFTGKEQLGTLFTDIFDSWEVIEMDAGWTEEQKAAGQDQPIYLGVQGSDGAKYLLRWTMYHYKATNGTEVTLPWHQVSRYNAENKIDQIATYYDRSELTNAYNGSDPIK